MSHYRELIEKLSSRHVERDDFEELYSVATESLAELPAADRTLVERHATVLAAAVVSQTKDAKSAVERLKTLEKQVLLKKVSFVPLEMGINRPPLPVKSRSTSFFSIVIYAVVALLVMMVLMGVLRR